MSFYSCHWIFEEPNRVQITNHCKPYLFELSFTRQLLNGKINAYLTCNTPEEEQGLKEFLMERYGSYEEASKKHPILFNGKKN